MSRSDFKSTDEGEDHEHHHILIWLFSNKFSFIPNWGVWPVPMKVPNAKTLKTFRETDKKNKLVSSKNTKEMFDKLGI